MSSFAALVVPFLGSRFYTFVATDIVILALFAMSLNLLLGYTGLVSFGHAAYFGIGAYTCALLMKSANAPFLPSLLAAGVMAGAFALLFGFFCVRLHQDLLCHADLGLRANRLGDLLQVERRHGWRAGPAQRALPEYGLDGRAANCRQFQGRRPLLPHSSSSLLPSALPSSGASSIRRSAGC